MLASPSILAAAEEEGVDAPRPAQSKSSAEPLVKKLCSREPRMEMRTRGLPSRSASALSSMAPAAGNGGGGADGDMADAVQQAGNGDDQALARQDKSHHTASSRRSAPSRKARKPSGVRASRA